MYRRNVSWTVRDGKVVTRFKWQQTDIVQVDKEQEEQLEIDVEIVSREQRNEF